MICTDIRIERTVRGAVKDSASKIEAFKRQFEVLRQDYTQGTALHGAVVTFRVLEKVDKIRE